MQKVVAPTWAHPDVVCAFVSAIKRGNWVSISEALDRLQYATYGELRPLPEPHSWAQAKRESAYCLLEMTIIYCLPSGFHRVIPHTRRPLTLAQITAARATAAYAPDRAHHGLGWLTESSLEGNVSAELLASGPLPVRLGAREPIDLLRDEGAHFDRDGYLSAGPVRVVPLRRMLGIN